MSDGRTRLRTAAAGLTRAIDAAESRSAWAAESPCEGWTAGDVADHIINNYARVAGSLGAEVATTGRRSEDWGTARDAVLAAASEPGALDTVVTGPDGPTPLGRFLAVYMVGLALGDVSFADRKSVVAFHRGLAMLAEIGMFFALGLLVFPSQSGSRRPTLGRRRGVEEWDQRRPAAVEKGYQRGWSDHGCPAVRRPSPPREISTG